MRLLDNNTAQMTVPNSTFTFSAIKPENLGATEYTLVTTVVDVSGSVSSYVNDLVNMLNAVVEACKKNPRAENLLFRVITFNGKIKEIHGFVPLSSISSYSLNDLKCGGNTALCAATYSAIEASNTYAKTLIDQDFSVNSAIYIITDGADNDSNGITAANVKNALDLSVQDEYVNSIVSVLIGINTSSCGSDLAIFQHDSGLTQYVDMGDATPGKLSKLGGFISKSISSASQSLNTGSPVTAAAAVF